LSRTPDKIADESLISHLLQNLFKNYKTLVDIITHRPIEGETVDSITTELIEYETSNTLFIAQVGSNTNTSGTIVDGHALVAETQGNPNHSCRGRGRGHSRTRRRGSGRGRGNGRKPYERSIGKCFYCTKEGHQASDCSLKQKGNKLKKETYDGWKGQKIIPGKYAANEDAENSTEMHAYAATPGNSSQDWLIDSGASHHLTGNKHSIQNLQCLPNSILVKIANRATCQATGIGSIQFHLDCGLLLTVQALYVPEFGKLSLLSVDAMNESGYEVIFRLSSYLVKSNSITEPQLIGKRQAGSRTCTLLGIMLEKAQAHSASTTNQIKPVLNTWYRRFAHINLDDLRLLLPKELYTEKESTRSECSICAQAKAK